MVRIRLIVVMTLVVFTTNGFCQAPPDLDRWKESGVRTRTAWSWENGLQSDNQGDPFRLTWGIFQEGATIFTNQPGSDFRTRMNQIYSGGESEWLPQMESVFNRWGSISGLEFTYEANDDGGSFFTTSGVLGHRADIRIGGRAIDGNSGVLAEAWSPNRDITFDTSDNFFENISGNSLRLRNVLAHEVGHTLGMAHVLNATPSYLMEASYISAFDGPQLHDIMMAQWGYGDAYEKANNFLGNNDFATAIEAGIIAPGSGYTIGEDARIDFNATYAEVFPEEIDFYSIDDETDIDVFHFSLGETSSLKITLEALGFQYMTGPLGGTPTPFNSRARSDLSFELFDSLENSLAFVNEQGLQGVETLALYDLTAGDYFVKIYGADNPDLTEIDTQFYSFSIKAVPEAGSGMACLTIGLLACCRRRRTQLMPS
ncbi:MAG: matrixin family metalloprotease [Pirellulaceae bacterium]